MVGVYDMIEKSNLKFSQGLTPFKQSIVKIVCHHPAHESWSLQQIHDYHRNSNGWIGAGYNYFITKDGRIQEGRGRNIGAHASGHNSNTLGVCFQGNFETQTMTDKQVQAGASLIAQLLRNEGLQISDVVGHKDLAGAATACPGKNFRMADLKQAVLEILNPNVKGSANVANHQPSNWAKPAWEKATKQGVVDGLAPQSPLTREMLAVILDRMGLLDK